MTDGSPTPNQQLSGMSDGALEQAIETTEAARRRTRHLVHILPDVGADVDYAATKAVVANERLGQLLRDLRYERARRDEDQTTLEDVNER